MYVYPLDISLHMYTLCTLHILLAFPHNVHVYMYMYVHRYTMYVHVSLGHLQYMYSILIVDLLTFYVYVHVLSIMPRQIPEVL